MTNINTPVGELTAVAVEEGLCILEFTDSKSFTNNLEQSGLSQQPGSISSENKHFIDLRTQLVEYFNGIRKAFTIPLIPQGTEFQKTVWNELLNIPFGSTRSYLEQASEMKKSESVRAVANANGMNPICILIPCHRVIGSDGRLTGYSGGLHRKKWLLDHEKRFSGQPVNGSLFT
jgi:AraC family transcriptional regulator of adaptative response/methylated-DNA-[protein]-cysteine methyltransferase